MSGLRRMRRRYRGIPVVVVLLAALAFGLTSSSADTADPATAPIANDVSAGLQSFAQSLTGLDSLNQLGQSLPFTSQVPDGRQRPQLRADLHRFPEGEARRAPRIHLPDRARGLPLDRHLRHLRRRRRHCERNGLSPDRRRAALHDRARAAPLAHRHDPAQARHRAGQRRRRLADHELRRDGEPQLQVRPGASRGQQALSRRRLGAAPVDDRERAGELHREPIRHQPRVHERARRRQRRCRRHDQGAAPGPGRQRQDQPDRVDDDGAAAGVRRVVHRVAR